MNNFEIMRTWLVKHNACATRREWALSTCTSLQDLWDKASDDDLVWGSTRPGVLDRRTLVRLALMSAERVRHLMQDKRSTDALDVLQRWLDKVATEDELRDAAYAACAAYAASAAARAASAAYAACAASAAARAASAAYAARAADDAAYAASAAARAASAACAADDAAAYATERKVQAEWIRDNASPDFDSIQKELTK